MQDFEKHIINERQSNLNGYKTAYCGASVSMDFAFLNAEHVLNTIEDEGRLKPCPKCKETILKLLNK